MARPRWETNRSPRRKSPPAHHERLPRRTSGTPRAGRDRQEGTRTLLLAWGPSLDRAIRKGMHNLPAEQKPHSQNKGAAIQNHGTRRQPPFHPSSHGPDHGTPKEPGLRQRTN